MLNRKKSSGESIAEYMATQEGRKATLEAFHGPFTRLRYSGDQPECSGFFPFYVVKGEDKFSFYEFKANHSKLCARFAQSYL